MNRKLHVPCPECGAEDGLIWHPKKGVGWYCHECGEGFEGPPNLHDILMLFDDMRKATSQSFGQVMIAVGALDAACNILEPHQWKRRGKV